MTPILKSFLDSPRFPLFREIARVACSNLVPGGATIVQLIDGIEKIGNEGDRAKTEEILQVVVDKCQGILEEAERMKTTPEQFDMFSQFGPIQEQLNEITKSLENISGIQEFFNNQFENLEHGQNKILEKVTQAESQRQKDVAQDREDTKEIISLLNEIKRSTVPVGSSQCSSEKLNGSTQQLKQMFHRIQNTDELLNASYKLSSSSSVTMQPFKPQMNDSYAGGSQWLPTLQGVAARFGDSWVPTRTMGFMGVDLTGIWGPDQMNLSYIRQYGPYLNIISGVGGSYTMYSEGIFDVNSGVVHVIGCDSMGNSMEIRVNLHSNWCLQGQMSCPVISPMPISIQLHRLA